jgi:hypothetical protein
MEGGAPASVDLTLSKWYEYKNSKFAYIQPPIILCTTTTTRVLLTLADGKKKKLFVITKNAEIRAFEKKVFCALQKHMEKEGEEKMEEVDELMEVIFVEESSKNTSWYGADYNIAQEPTIYPWSGECLLYLEAVRVTKTAGRDTIRVKFNLAQILIRSEEQAKSEKVCVFAPDWK